MQIPMIDLIIIVVLTAGMITCFAHYIYNREEE